MIFFLALATVVSTFLGGLFALRFRDKLHLILGFSAGAMIGVAFFDLLPEAVGLAEGKYGVSAITALVAAGFFFFMILNRLLHVCENEEHSQAGHQHQGRLGAGSLAVHSFLDGMAIGLAFQVSSAVGFIVTTAILVHDFSDGINTVNLILKNNGTAKSAFRWLVLDALAPLAGVFTAMFVTLSQSALGVLLALFCGFFLHIGASDLLPESYHRHPTKWTTLATLAGAFVLFFAVRLAGI